MGLGRMHTHTHTLVPLPLSMKATPLRTTAKTIKRWPVLSILAEDTIAAVTPSENMIKQDRAERTVHTADAQ